MKNEEILKGEKNKIRTYVITLGLSNGSKGVMFVLYSILRPEFYKSTHVDPYAYLGQLADDIDNACVNARKRVGVFEIEIWDEESFNRAKPLYIPFGKYKGMSIEEVFDIDYKYIFWFANNTNVKSKKLRAKLKDYALLSKELITEGNKEKAMPFLPFHSNKVIRKLYIYSVRENDWGLTTRMVDADGNKFQYTGKEIGKPKENIEFTAKIKKNFSSMGCNFNVLNLR